MLDEGTHNFGENVRARRKTKGQNDNPKIFSNPIENPRKTEKSLPDVRDKLQHDDTQT